MKNKYIIISLILTFLSCDKGKKVLKKSTETIKNSVNYLDTIVVKKSIEYFDRKKRVSDSIQLNKLLNYFEENNSKYSEYRIIQSWFESNPVQLQNLKGNFYKILNSVVHEGKNINRNNYEYKSERNTYKYFYETEEYYFILDLEVIKEKIVCNSVRRIGVGFGDEEMYDIIYENNEIKKEIFQSYVNPELFEKEDKLYFEFSKEVENGDIINTINLGKSIF
ncbi:hypothetical protein Q4595_15965 [Wenyingzhuangia sp. 1_MG-2023]|nr:hypothetical protein [Wenyingzhuangia sp. 1_MG-2023]